MKRIHMLLAVVLLAASLVGGYPLTGSVKAAPTELFFSEYVEGSLNNKALEIYNGTSSTVDLSAGEYNVEIYYDGSTSAGLTIHLNGTVAAGDVFVLAHTMASSAILVQADQTNGGAWFTGDDAVVLSKSTEIIDVIGQIGVDPGSEWGSSAISTKNNTLRRKLSIEAGDPNGNDPFNPAIEWNGFGNDTFDGLGNILEIVDTAPSVMSTTPANGAINVALNSTVVITFTEPVIVSPAWFSITCETSGLHEAIPTGGPVTFTLSTELDFGSNEVCHVTVNASGVSDMDTNDPPDLMAVDYTFSFSTADKAPAVASTTPIHGTTGVLLNSDISVTFSEPVNVIEPWFSVTCATTGAHSAGVQGGPTTFTLNPDVDFGYNEECTVIVTGSAVSDQDTNDPPNLMTGTFTLSFTTEDVPPPPTFFIYLPVIMR